MTDYSAHDIHLLDQGAVDALRAVDALAADPETTRRLNERGEAVYGAELTQDLHNTVAGKSMSLAGWAAFATIRLVQLQARHDEAARVWEEDTDAAYAKVDEITAAIAAAIAPTVNLGDTTQAAIDGVQFLHQLYKDWVKTAHERLAKVDELTAELDRVRAELEATR